MVHISILASGSDPSQENTTSMISLQELCEILARKSRYENLPHVKRDTKKLQNKLLF